jgi:bifunctional DNA-binding transcriptional regulator/antitoxin component of YhaV-PrlF toxin-antitoxin module
MSYRLKAANRAGWADDGMSAVKGKMVEGGRIIVPAAFRKAMGVTKGDTLIMELHGDELRVRSARAALRRIQERLKDHAPAAGERLVSDELLEDRRKEAADE